LDSVMRRVNTVRLWDVATGKERRSFQGAYQTVSATGQRVLTADEASNAHVWDAETGKEIAVLNTGLQPGSGDMRFGPFSPDGRRVATVGINDHIARVFEVKTGKQIVSWKGPPTVIRSVVFDADGKRLLTAGDGATARLWNAATGQEMAVFAGHSADLTSAV